MSVKSVIAHVIPSFPHVSALVHGSSRTARKGTSLRVYREETILSTKSPLVDAITELLKLGLSVKVYEGSFIHTPVLENGEIAAWSPRRTSKRRSKVVVEVNLW